MLGSLRRYRSALGHIIVQWCGQLRERDLDNPLRYTKYHFKGESHNKRLGDLTLHLFPHQVHHRGEAAVAGRYRLRGTDLPKSLPDLSDT